MLLVCYKEDIAGESGYAADFAWRASMEIKYIRGPDIMRIKILYVCFILSFFINVALSIFLLNRKPVCGHVHIDDIDRTKDVIPDGETAIKLAKEKLLYEEDYPYEYTAVFNGPSYEWIVFFQHRECDRYTLLDGEHVLWLRRDYGIVSNYCQ